MPLRPQAGFPGVRSGSEDTKTKSLGPGTNNDRITSIYLTPGEAAKWETMKLGC